MRGRNNGDFERTISLKETPHGESPYGFQGFKLKTLKME